MHTYVSKFFRESERERHRQTDRRTDGRHTILAPIINQTTQMIHMHVHIYLVFNKTKEIKKTYETEI